jgi:hypothetical protein
MLPLSAKISSKVDIIKAAEKLMTKVRAPSSLIAVF